MHHVVIIGGGFGGLAAARALYGQPVRITLVDRSNHHLFQPLLYQVATAALAPADIAEPIRGVLASQANARVRLGTVTAVHPSERRIVLSQGDDLGYDTLIVAAGVTHSYFGHSDWQQHAPGLKTLGDALRIRDRLLRAFEAAEWCEDPQRRERLLTFVVVGGGPTGVELAGALREIAFSTLRDNFRNIAPETARVVLVEGADGVLGSFAPDLQRKAKRQLEKLGVEVRLNTFVTQVDEQGVQLGDDRLEAATVLWAAGVQASPLATTLGVPLDRVGRVLVNPDLSIPGHPEVMVIGDLVHFEQDGVLVPGVAPVAQAQGQHAAANVIADHAGVPRSPFVHYDKGSMATIGRKKAVLSLFSGRIRMAGFFAWLIWVFVHLMVIVGYRNRVIVFVKWAWAWFTFDRTSRLIWRDEEADVDRVGGDGLQRADRTGP